MKDLIGNFRLADLDLGADRDIAGISLRHIDEHAQGIGLGHGEQGDAAAAGVDEIAEIDIARGDDAVKRRLHMLEAGHFLQLLDICRGGVLKRDRGVEGVLMLVEVLPVRRKSCLNSFCQRSSATLASTVLALACSSWALPWASCWSSSGVSRSASDWPLTTRVPMSTAKLRT